MFARRSSGIAEAAPAIRQAAGPICGITPPKYSHAVAAAAVVKQEGKPNDMIARVEADPAFGLTREEIEAELSPEAFTGRSSEQVTEFLRDVIQPVLDANKEDLGQHVELSV